MLAGTTQGKTSKLQIIFDDDADIMKHTAKSLPEDVRSNVEDATQRSNLRAEINAPNKQC